MLMLMPVGMIKRVTLLLAILLFSSLAWSASLPDGDDDYVDSYTLAQANTELYKVMFKYMAMDDVELKQMLAILLKNFKKADVDISSKDGLFEIYSTLVEKVVDPLVKLKDGKGSYNKYSEKVYSLTKNGSAEAYMALTEYLFRNYKKDLLNNCDNYDALNLRTDYGLMVGFLGKDPMLFNKKYDGKDASMLYEAVVLKLIEDKINPFSIFTKDVVDKLEEAADVIDSKDEFELLYDVKGNGPTSTQADYSEKRVTEVLVKGKMTLGDVTPLRSYVTDMISKGNLKNAEIAIAALKDYGENVTGLETVLSTKKEVLVPASYYETSNIPRYLAEVRYLDLEQEKASTMKESELIYKGLSIAASRIGGYDFKKEDANFLNEAVLPYMFETIGTLTSELSKTSIKGKERTKLENRMLVYAYGTNMLCEALIASPMMVTAGLKYYSPVKLESVKEDLLSKAREVMRDKILFDDCAKSEKDYSKTYELLNDIKDIKL